MHASVGCLFFLGICMCLMHTGNYHHDDIYRNVTSRLVYVCMYAIDNRFELQERKKKQKKGRFSIWFFFRSSPICIDNSLPSMHCLTRWIEIGCLCQAQTTREATRCRSSNNGVVNVMSFTHNKRNSSFSTRITHQSNNVCINTYANLVVLSGSIGVLSILIIYLVTNVLYSIWLQRWERGERERRENGEKLAPMLSSRVPYHHHHHHNNIAWRFQRAPVATNQATFVSRDCWSLSRHRFLCTSYNISSPVVGVPCLI